MKREFHFMHVQAVTWEKMQARMESRLKDIIEIFKNKRLTDILILGYAARQDEASSPLPPSIPNNAMYFMPDRDYIYLHFEKLYVKLSAWGSTHGSFMSVTPVMELAYSFPIDEADYHAKSSYLDLLLHGSGQSYQVTQATWFYNEECNLEAGEMLAVELTIAHKHQLFFDNISIEGIEIGSNTRRREWEEWQVSRGRTFQISCWTSDQQEELTPIP